MGGLVEIRVYSDGTARVRVDHPSNDPAVEFAMLGIVFSLQRQAYAAAGIPFRPGPMRWHDDPPKAAP